MMLNRGIHHTAYSIVPIVIGLILRHSTLCICSHESTGSESNRTLGSINEGKDVQFQLDTNSTSQSIKPSRLPRNLTIIQSRDNALLRSRFKKPGTVLTLSLRPKGRLAKSNSKDKSSTPETHTNTTRKPYTMLDRLRKLTNLKLRKSSSGTDFGFKNVDTTPEDDIENSETVSAATTEDPESGKSLSTKVGGHLSHNIPNPDFKTKGTVTLVMQASTPNPTIATISLVDSDKLQAGSSDVEEERIEQEETRYITADQIGGNRPTSVPFHFTTTTTTPPPPTQAYKRPTTRQRKLYSPHNHIYAPTQDPINIPHNEEDLSVQDVQDYRAAQLTFGSKVGAKVIPGTVRPTSPIPPVKVEQVTRPSVQQTLPPRSRSRVSPTKKTTAVPQSASSGVKNSHIKIKQNSDNSNDNLPFYKEPGGVFDQKYQDNDNEPNEVNQQFDDRAPAVRYAPKGPSAQAQQHITYNNPSRSPQRNYHQPQPLAPHHQPPQRHFNHPPQHQQQPVQPQYVTVTQQPVYLSPVPVHQVQPQQVYNGYPAHNPPPQQNYYPTQQYYPVPVRTTQHGPIPGPGPHYQPNYNQPAPAHHSHTQQPPYPPTQPIYIQAAPAPIQNSQNRFLHFNQPQTTTPDYSLQNVHNPPPDRYDPASDYYYGDPRPSSTRKDKSSPSNAAPGRGAREPEDVDEEEYNGGKGKSKNRNSGRRPPPPRKNGKYNSNKEEDEPEEEEEEEEPPKPTRSDRNRDADYERPRVPPPARRRQNSRPNYDDYDTDPNENIGEFVRPAQHEHSERAYNDRRPNDEFVSLDNNNFGTNNGRQFNPSERDNNFRPSPPDNGPNFEHPNIEYPGTGRRAEPQQQQQRPAKRIGDYDDDRFDTRLPPLDPIYTRTIQQYDEENTAPARGKGNNREVEPTEDYPPPPFDLNEDPFPPSSLVGPKQQRKPPPPPPPAPREEEEDDEHPPQEDHRDQRDRRPPPSNDDEEEEEDERPRGRPAPQQNQNDDEEEVEEEEPPQKRRPEEDEEQKPQEEEEEEETEEDENENRRKSKRQPEEKKPPPEKPKSEKTGNLDDDISGIEKEFGFTVPHLDLNRR